MVRPSPRRCRLCLTLLLTASLAACAASSPAPSASGAEPDGRITALRAQGPDAPIAFIYGRPITLDDLGPALLEAAGRTVLDEVTLDIAVNAEARRRGVTVSAADLARERDLFLRSIAEAGVAHDDADAEAMLLEVRRARGLGEDRFGRLLRRSALLRAMVRDDATVTDAMIALAHEIEHGERRRARLIITPTLSEAQRALDALRAGADFAETAARFSTDASAVRGGVVEPISPADPTYPDALRTALARATPGDIAGPITLDSGFAIVRLDETLPPDGVSLADSHDALARRLRLQEERRLMAALARRLTDRVSVTIRDDHLRSGG